MAKSTGPPFWQYASMRHPDPPVCQSRLPLLGSAARQQAQHVLTLLPKSGAWAGNRPRAEKGDKWVNGDFVQPPPKVVGEHSLVRSHASRGPRSHKRATKHVEVAKVAACERCRLAQYSGKGKLAPNHLVCGPQLAKVREDALEEEVSLRLRVDHHIDPLRVPTRWSLAG
eukprot:CAMPEP_0115830540 /NCGR_PEP_ID=MMETSP0287-20121206/1668_1 /TAXON_ID=412157 /ORGANISM="Chrysochromulina rotalis, Strain UIO044" /LENGTH=169 /DNA_ID=CAMNT_0003283843 /DNA_START=269 /DNA_END=779 /DNA_ORIENTATION=+